MWLGLTMIMIVGATFAWFAENRNVQADGMSVQAETVKNLLIANNANNATYATSATSTLTNVQTLAPASTATAANDASFFAAVDETRTNGYINAATGQTTGTPASPFVPFRAAHIADDNTDYATYVTNGSSEKHIEVAKHEFLVKTDNTSLGSLYISGLTVTPANATSAISAALRVAVVCGENAFIFAPVTATVTVEQQSTTVSPTTTYNGITANSGSSSAVTISSIPANWVNSGTPVYVLASSVSTTATTVYVYIWYEGQDANCTSANSANVENLTVSVQFSALEAPANNG